QTQFLPENCHFLGSDPKRQTMIAGSVRRYSANSISARKLAVQAQKRADFSRLRKSNQPLPGVRPQTPEEPIVACCCLVWLRSTGGEFDEQAFCTARTGRALGRC